MGKFCQWVVCFCLVVIAGAQCGQLWLMRSMEETLGRMPLELYGLSSISSSVEGVKSEVSYIGYSLKEIKTEMKGIEEGISDLPSHSSVSSVAEKIDEGSSSIAEQINALKKILDLLI